VWVWPQSDWPARIGRAWPPPVDGQVPLVDVRRTTDAIRCAYGPVPGYGFGIIRTHELLSDGSLTITSRFTGGQSTPAPPPVAVWSVMQLRRPGHVFARLIDADDAAPVALVPFDAQSLIAVQRQTGRVIELKQSDDRARKSGFDADRLAALTGNTLLLLELMPAPGTYRAGERAQVFFDGVKDAARSIIELEFTSPLAPAPPELVVRCSLHRVESIEQAVDIVEGKMTHPTNNVGGAVSR
jgi:hypothetical protein